MKLGHLQTNMLTFVQTRPGFHHIAKDAITLRVARSLQKRNLIKLESYLGDYVISDVEDSY